MKRYSVTIALLSLLVAGLALTPGSAQTTAASGVGLTVSPAKFELSMPPGTTYNIPVTIQNGTTAATHIQASLVDYTVRQDGQAEFLPVGKLPYSLMKWASINPREFDLAAGNIQQVRVTLAVPKKDLSGEYAGIVFFQTRPTRQGPGRVAFSVRIATKIYMTIPDTVKLGGAIEKFAAKNASGGELYRVLFKNTGNAHEYLNNGEVQIHNAAGELVDRLPMPRNALVERGGSLLIQLSGKSLPRGTYQAIATVDYGGKTMTGGEIEFKKT